MTIYNKASLQSFFETGDVPSGTNFADFIDSCVNMAETDVQSMAGAINPTEVITARVSAGTGIFTGNVTVNGITSSKDIYAETIRASAVSVTGLMATTVSATNGFFGSTGIVSAAGSAQATAAPLNFVINVGTGVVDGQTTGFLLTSNKQGLTQYITNGGASANLWPCVGGQINALSSNAAFAMAANTLYMIIHTRASGYAVK